MNVSISSKRLTIGLALIVATLTVLSLGGQFSKYYLDHDYLLGLVPLFDVAKEANIPTWYSSMTLLLSSALLAAISIAKRSVQSAFARHWMVLAIIFFGLSVDEGSMIHELSTRPLRNMLGARGILYYTWVVPGSLFVLVVFAAYLRFLRALPRRTCRLFLLAGGLYVAGSLGMNLLGGWHHDLYGPDNMAYAWMTAVEESLEMFGIVVFIHALVVYMASEKIKLQLIFADDMHASR